MTTAAPLITRGMGAESRMVTQGYGGIVAAVVAAVAEVTKAAVIRGKSAVEQIPEILYIVKASLLEINNKELLYPLTGVSRKIVDNTEEEPKISAQLKTEDVKSALREILIKAVPVVRAKFLDGKKRE